MLFIILLLLPGVRLEESLPSSLLSPRNFNHHAFDTVQFIKKSKGNKKGPILFPNDGPPPAPTPLIVTSRPLIESIRRSDLNPNNTIQASSQQVNQVFSPNVLSRLKNYQPYVFSAPSPNPIFASPSPTPLFASPSSTPVYKFGRGYSELVEERLGSKAAYEYDYQQRTELPPIYRAISNNANNIVKQKPIYEYQQIKSPDYSNYQQSDEVQEKTSKEYNSGENYAFSYTVRDRDTGDDFSHSQRSTGQGTNGEYRVRLPDGRMQIVSYTADENGYKADVRYDDDQNDDAKGNRIDTEVNKANRYQDNYNYNRYLVDERKIHPVNNNLYNNKDYYQEDDRIEERHRENDRQADYIITDNDYTNIGQHNEKSVEQQNDRNLNNDYNGQQNHDNDYYLYSDDAYSSKEYKDYSQENTEYQPHRSKYESFAVNDNPKPTVKPSYEELKDLFVNKLFRNPRIALFATTFRPNVISNQLPVSSTISPAVSNSFTPVSSTLSPNFDSTTEKVVIIGTKRPLFTNIKGIVSNSVTPSPLSYTTAVPIGSTPSSYLFSTITNLKNKISLSNKPELSPKYIDKINRYLSYK